MVFANQQCSRTRERLPIMPILNRVDALNEDRLGKGASNSPCCLPEPLIAIVLAVVALTVICACQGQPGKNQGGRYDSKGLEDVML